MARQADDPGVLRVYADSTVYFVDDNIGQVLSSQDARSTVSQHYVRASDRWIRHDTVKAVVSGVRPEDDRDSIAYDILGRSSFPGADPSTCWSLYTNGNLKHIDVTKRQVLRTVAVPLDGLDPDRVFLYSVIGDSVLIYTAPEMEGAQNVAVMNVLRIGESQPRITHRLRPSHYAPWTSSLIYSSVHDAFVLVEARQGLAYAVMFSEHSPTREVALEGIEQDPGNRAIMFHRAMNDSILVVLKTGGSSYSLVDLYTFEEMPGPNLDDLDYEAMDVFDNGKSVGFFYGDSYQSRLNGIVKLNLETMETTRVPASTHVRPLYDGEHYLKLGDDLTRHYLVEYSTLRTSIDPWLFEYPMLTSLPIMYYNSPLTFYSSLYQATGYPQTLAEWTDGYYWLQNGYCYRDVRFLNAGPGVSVVRLTNQEDLPIATTRRDQVEVFDEELNHHVASIRVHSVAPRLLLSTDRRWLITKQGFRESQAFSVDHFAYQLGDPEKRLSPYQEADRKEFLYNIGDCDLSRSSNRLYYATEDGHLVALSLSESYERDTIISTLRGPHWVDVSPDGSLLAVIDSLELRVLDVPGHQVVSRYHVPKNLHAFSWSEDGRSFYIGNEESVYAKYEFQTTHVRENVKAQSVECDPAKVVLRGGQLEFFGAHDEYSVTIADVSGRILTTWQGTPSNSPVTIPIPSHASQVLLVVVSAGQCSSVQAVVNTTSY